MAWTLLLVFHHSVYAETLVIRHPFVETEDDKRSKVFYLLLKLALDKTEEMHGAYKLIPFVLDKIPERLNKSVKTGQWHDITTSISTNQLEQTFLPIRIPLLKGLIGYRLFLVNKNDKYKFKSINKLEDLMHLKAGQNKGWPDTQILRDNGIQVVTSSEYKYLFDMLKRERFDYFPRSIMEIFSELNLHDDLAIAENIAVYYPAAFYFFVNKNNIELANRIEKGLRIAIADGSYDETLLKIKGYRWAFEQLKNTKRNVIKLNNSFLPKNTPLQEKNLWYFSNLN